MSKFAQPKAKKKANKYRGISLPIQKEEDSKIPVAVKELKMNRLDFGEIVFGGSLKKNLKIEANMNKTVTMEK